MTPAAIEALKETDAPAAPSDAARTSDDPHTALVVRLLCAACKSFVTTSEARCEVSGSHAHTFVNPAGIIYKIGCFREAPGAFGVGEPSDHWPWFPGYVWQTLACAQCFEHLGWAFRGVEGSFVGLILERLLEG